MNIVEKHKILLREIAGGKTVFAPAGDSDSDIQTFQIQARDLIDLSDYGYITTATPHKENMSGHRRIDRVYNCKITSSGLAEI